MVVKVTDMKLLISVGFIKKNKHKKKYFCRFSLKKNVLLIHRHEIFKLLDHKCKDIREN